MPSSLRAYALEEGCKPSLATQAQRRDQALVTAQVLSTEIAEESPTLADQHEEPSTRCMVMAVRPEVACELADAAR
jgi:hypothetical protein